jgi:hypothetical protein
MKQQKKIPGTPIAKQKLPRLQVLSSLQRKAAASSERKTPAAPPAYRPHPLPLVLQRKVASPSSVQQRIAGAAQPQSRIKGPPVYRSQPIRKVLQPKATAAPPSRPSAVPGRIGVRALVAVHQTLGQSRLIQLAQQGPLPPKKGQEQGVDWYWAQNINLQFPRPDGGIEGIPRHPLHDRNVAALGGNHFYGSYTLVRENGTHQHHNVVFEAHPTMTEHTEPQYMQWFKNEMLFALYHQQLAGVAVVILEINQTNTPCSMETCRKSILNWVSGNEFPSGHFMARMSAYQMYESQYPKVQISTIDIGKFHRRDTTPVTIEGPMVVHRVPEKQ